MPVAYSPDTDYIPVSPIAYTLTLLNEGKPRSPDDGSRSRRQGEYAFIDKVVLWVKVGNPQTRHKCAGLVLVCEQQEHGVGVL